VAAGQQMTTSRLEAFSDGVLAIIITVMVLELRVPAGHDLAALRHSAGTGLLTYLLSFITIGTYWSNHHHMFQLTDRISASILWANLHLLFWLSLLPFTTSWLDSSALAKTPVLTYGMNLIGAAAAYLLLQARIIRSQGEWSALRQAVGHDTKGKTSATLYLAGIACTWLPGPGTHVPTDAALGCYATAAILWLVPDRRITRVIEQRDN
jgi:uncharacterized membrane protein